MAESGFFRVGFRGFKKQDVLTYIDEMQTASAKRISEVDDLRRGAEEAASESAQQASEAQARVAELEESVGELQSQIEKLTALAQVYKRELLQLREQVAEQEVKAADTDAQAKISELEESCALLTEQNARYAAVVGDVSRLVVEARIVSSSYFDAAHQKSTDCLKQLETFLDGLKSQTKLAAQNAELHHRSGEAHMQTLLSDLQQLGASLPAAAKK